MLRVLLLLLLLALPALSTPNDYLKSADSAWREAGLYRRQFLASFSEAKQFRGAVYQSATSYNRSLSGVLARVERLTPGAETARYHEALLVNLKTQAETAASLEVKVTGLVWDEEQLAKTPAKNLKDSYQRHLAEFAQFVGSIESKEKPSLDEVIKLRLQLKPDFELESRL